MLNTKGNAEVLYPTGNVKKADHHARGAQHCAGFQTRHLPNSGSASTLRTTTGTLTGSRVSRSR
eukprot:scaffold135798_cov18-Tisochrysis_lutea.AAC.1